MSEISPVASLQTNMDSKAQVIYKRLLITVDA